MSKVKDALLALKNQLAQITPAKGFLTDLEGRVQISFLAYDLDNLNPKTPRIIVQHGATVRAEAQTRRARLEYTPEIMMVVDASGDTEQFITALIDLEADVRACLHHAAFEQALDGEAMKIEVGVCDPAVIEDSRYALAVLPVTLTIIENYGD